MKRSPPCGILAVMVAVLCLAGSAWGTPADLLWERSLSYSARYDTVQISAIAASTTAFIISGYAYNSADGAYMGFVKALDVNTGKVKWSYTLDVGTKVNSMGSLIVDGDIVIVMGFASSYTQNLPDPPDYTLFKNYIWAYDADTGKLLWRDVKNFEQAPPQPPFNKAGSVTTLVANNHLYTINFSRDSHGTIDYSRCIIRAYQVRDSITSTPRP